MARHRRLWDIWRERDVPVEGQMRFELAVDGVAFVRYQEG